MNKYIIFLLTLNISTFCQVLIVEQKPELFAPGIVSVAGSQVKITFSKDGNLVLWGEVNRNNGIGGFDIWQAVKNDTGWSNPKPVGFNTVHNEFDPSFSADGKILYFFSNRPGGEGGDDIYFADYDSINMRFGEPMNIGNKINTKGDEWGPTESADGAQLIFCTDGLGGQGEHDIFICKKTHKKWGPPTAITNINSPQDDFDPIFLSDCSTIVFTKKYNEDEAYMFVSYLSKDGYSKPEKLDNKINISGTWNFGSSPDPVDHSCFYYSTHREEDSQGRLDIFKVKYILKDKEEITQ